MAPTELTHQRYWFSRLAAMVSCRSTAGTRRSASSLVSLCAAAAASPTRCHRVPVRPSVLRWEVGGDTSCGGLHGRAVLASILIHPSYKSSHSCARTTDAALSPPPDIIYQLGPPAGRNCSHVSDDASDSYAGGTPARPTLLQCLPTVVVRHIPISIRLAR
jgi:hypothetical protein